LENLGKWMENWENLGKWMENWENLGKWMENWEVLEFVLLNCAASTQ
jgi:hypothetical protein